MTGSRARDAAVGLRPRSRHALASPPARGARGGHVCHGRVAGARAGTCLGILQTRIRKHKRAHTDRLKRTDTPHTRAERQRDSPSAAAFQPVAPCLVMRVLFSDTVKVVPAETNAAQRVKQQHVRTHTP